MKVWALAPQEDWICDRFVKEWNEHSEHGCTDPRDADVIWLLADWCWAHVPLALLKSKPVIATVHHIVPEKFGQRELEEFMARDQYVDAYHVPCLKTREQVLKIVGPRKKILCQPFWVNDKLWRPLPALRNGIRTSLGIAPEDFVVGSFQRDTEGSDLITPKLEKGPDLFSDAVIELQKLVPSLKVLLSGWRRQYVMKRLETAGVPYVYVERPTTERIVELYNALDAYIVAARYEGGPQAIVECAAIGVPIASRDVGVASEILHTSCVGDALHNIAFEARDPININYARRSVEKLYMPGGFAPFVEFFKTLHERRSGFSRVSPGVGNREGDV